MLGFNEGTSRGKGDGEKKIEFPEQFRLGLIVCKATSITELYLQYIETGCNGDLQFPSPPCGAHF